ncbi:MAG: tetratricopeptide repeat protein [Desulfofustis sp.]|jgi:tetratricopeptide (TPR) repeat protein|nr:tetratricopeptide repeat protein [Desulfofustis sp.]
MSTPIQKIDSITSIEDACGEQGQAAKSQAQRDYEEGRGYVERGEAALAAVSLHNALRGFEEENNRQGMANASNQMGHACMLKDEFDRAIANYQNAWKICEELGDHVSLLSLAKQLAQAHQGAKEYRRALDLCLDLLDSYQRNNDPQNTVEVLERMASIYKDAGEKEKAADAYKTAAAIHRNYRHNKFADALKQKAEDLMKEAE